MTWSTPLTAVDGDILTAAQYNKSVRDNMLEMAAVKATGSLGYFVTSGSHSVSLRVPQKASVTASETTASVPFANLATVGPQVTVTCGTNALAIWAARHGNETAGSAALTSVEVSGASTIAAEDSWAMCIDGQNGGTASTQCRHTGFHLFTNLTPGDNVFTMKYRAASNTARFSDRTLLVFPF